MKILVVGATGMIGNAMIRVLSEKADWEVFGTARAEISRRLFRPDIAERLVFGVDAEQHDTLVKAFTLIRPDVVINCAGLTKHKPYAEDPLVSIPINSLMPHRLAGLCKLASARLIHVSTDCVFSGEQGNYTEEAFADARDVYGKSKALGEVDYPHAVTLRTSTIGHEFETKYGLLEWFLSQEGRCKGYNRAVFSGLPTVVFARVVRDVIITNSELSGIYHVAAKAINKFELLKLIADVYGKEIEIELDDGLVINRSLDATRFREATGYVAPAWPELVKTMYHYH